MKPKELILFSKSWLSEKVFPLWVSQGIENKKKYFAEALSFQGTPIDLPLRAMVQCRQIYSFATGASLAVCSETMARKVIVEGAQFLIENYQQEDGSFAHSILPDGTLNNKTPELYTQAFCLFGLAQAYKVTGNPLFKNRAQLLRNYLNRSRSLPAGGYSELGSQGEVFYRSNPHMHLFEAVISWMQIDSDSEWSQMGNEIYLLCHKKFYRSESFAIGEYFTSDWNPIIEQKGFIYEPGHQYEWAWLLSLYEDLTGQNFRSLKHGIFLNAEKHGVCRDRKIVFDEMWSHHEVKSKSSRFWPQCERVKAAVRLGMEVRNEEQSKYAFAADEALNSLLQYLNTPLSGLWYDSLSENNIFKGDSAKASSLYHIINAMEEYIQLRPSLVEFQ